MNKQVRALKPCPFCGKKEKINGAAKDPFDEWSKVLIECETDGCPGWKDADECPHDGKFHPNHPACKECEEDALAAMRECEEEFKTII